ncbi:TnsD family transposase [Clostridium sp. WILCCON 0269]|uniref:TnsD family transposase n=1 Tax=Candidatus Clostridium eludens TaxID=3381663 RepID=A0ABW8SLM2_9CLOT
MLYFFTDPYKDELIYSAIARYHYYTGNIDYKDILEELFGKRTIIPSFEIGSNIESLTKNLGGKYTSDYIINKHTMFPFYSPFLPSKRKKQILKEIKLEDGNGLYTKIGIIAGSICVKEGIYYCPLCAKGDTEKYGEAYIHREHQLQGIMECHKHEVKLKRYPISKLEVSRLQYIRLDENLLDLNERKTEKDKYQDKLLKLAKDAYYLLNQDFNKLSKENVYEKYKNLLYERDLASSSGRIRQMKLNEEFMSFYGEEFLGLMESTIDIDDEFNWLKIATRKGSRTVHPVRHLLLINFLQTDISQFFKEINYKYNPFGKGPWLCLNKAADHYGKRVVRDLKITEDYKTRVPVGTFNCSCGFVYSRKGPDKTEKDKYKIGRVKCFGATWENKLKRLLSSRKYGVREISNVMGCDAKTAIKYANKLELLSSINTEAVNRELKGRIEKTNTRFEGIYKNDVDNFIKNNEGCTRQQIRNNLKKQYIWLYRHDKDWLYNKLPEAIPRAKRNKNNKERVDWDKRDIEIKSLISAKKKEMLSEKKSIRITKSSIGKAIGLRAMLDKKIDKLPKTKEYLDEITESVEQFQIRRCKQVIDKKLKEEEPIKLWEVQRKAAIRNEVFKKLTGKLQKYINMEDRK